MSKSTSTRAAATALRADGRAVVTGAPRWDDASHFWIIGSRGVASVVNVQTHSVLGWGCINHPDYVATRDALVAEACALLDRAGIPYVRSLTPDQLFLSGYEPTSYTPAEMARWRAQLAA